MAEESIRRCLAVLKDELTGDQATPLEKLLTDLVAVTWLASQQAEIAAASPAGGSLQQARYRLRRAESAQRRFHGAVKSLSLVRALVPRGLLPPAPVVEPPGEDGDQP